jgi:hypothetical protein
MPKTPISQGGGNHMVARYVDHAETYGPEVVRRFAQRIPSLRTVVDLGAGRGRDLSIVKAVHPRAHLSAIECDPDNAKAMGPSIWSSPTRCSNIRRRSFGSSTR